MPDDHRERQAGGDTDDSWLAQPDLGPVQALADRAELAEAVSRLAGDYGRPLRPDDPLAPLARDLARAPTLAGFTLHHCVQDDPLYRLGGVCLLPVAAGSVPTDGGGVVVSWTTHKLLSLDWDRWSEQQSTHVAMNHVLADVLDALGFRVRPFGQGGASIVTGRRAGGHPAGAGR
jgi:hypothetical protein